MTLLYVHTERMDHVLTRNKNFWIRVSFLVCPDPAILEFDVKFKVVVRFPIDVVALERFLRAMRAPYCFATPLQLDGDFQQLTM